MQSKFIGNLLIAVFVMIFSNVRSHKPIGGESSGRFPIRWRGCAGANVVVQKTKKRAKNAPLLQNFRENISFFRSNLSFYTITIIKQGFAVAESKNVQLSVGQELNFNVTLQPEGTTAVVNVVSNSEAAINTASASMSANVNQREVAGFPLNGRQAFTALPASSGRVNTGSGNVRRHTLFRSRSSAEHRSL